MRARATITTLMVLAAAMTAGGGATASPKQGGSAPPTLVTTDTQAITFGPVEPGTTSGPETVTVTNRGPGATTTLHVATTAGSAFSRSGGTCTSVLEEGASCTADLTYEPTGTVAQAGVASVVAAGGTNTRIYLTGRPVVAAFPLQVTATSVDFGSTKIGADTPAQGPRITNTSDAPVSFTVERSAPATPFSPVATSCSGSPVVLAPGASCGAGYRAHPTAPTTAVSNTTLSIALTGGTTREFPVELRSTGAWALSDPLRVTPRTLDFGDIPTGTTSPPQDVTVTNTTKSPVSFKIVGFKPGAGRDGNTVMSSTTCATSLAAGASCTITYAAQIGTATSMSRTTSMYFEIVGRSRVTAPIALTARGVGITPVLSISRADIDLGPTSAQVTTPPVAITVSNRGAAPITDLSVAQNKAPLSPYLQGGSCGSTLAPGTSCTMEISYAATDSSRRIAGMTVSGSGQTASFLTRSGMARTVHSAFAAQLSLVFLGGYPGANGDPTIEANLDDGRMTRRQAVDLVVASPQRLGAMVDALYHNTLGRSSDPKGRAYWIEQLQSRRMTVADVTAAFYSSGEYFVRTGSNTDAWLADVYFKILRRSPDKAGIEHWAVQTARYGRRSVALRLFQSLESRRVRVSSLYGVFLLRPPDPAGLAFWADKVLTRGDIALAADIGSSDEFLRVSQDLQRGMV